MKKTKNAKTATPPKKKNNKTGKEESTSASKDKPAATGGAAATTAPTPTKHYIVYVAHAGGETPVRAVSIPADAAPRLPSSMKTASPEDDTKDGKNPKALLFVLPTDIAILLGMSPGKGSSLGRKDIVSDYRVTYNVGLRSAGTMILPPKATEEGLCAAVGTTRGDAQRVLMQAFYTACQDPARTQETTARGIKTGGPIIPDKKGPSPAAAAAAAAAVAAGADAGAGATTTVITELGKRSAETLGTVNGDVKRHRSLEDALTVIVTAFGQILAPVLHASIRDGIRDGIRAAQKSTNGTNGDEVMTEKELFGKGDEDDAKDS